MRLREETCLVQTETTKEEKKEIPSQTHTAAAFEKEPAPLRAALAQRFQNTAVHRTASGLQRDSMSAPRNLNI